MIGILDRKEGLFCFYLVVNVKTLFNHGGLISISDDFLCLPRLYFGILQNWRFFCHVNMKILLSYEMVVRISISYLYLYIICMLVPIYHHRNQLSYQYEHNHRSESTMRSSWVPYSDLILNLMDPTRYNRAGHGVYQR